jgi:putative hydrolase of the HAD superfamily
VSHLAVTFDFGQTLTELDCPFLQSRLTEIDVEADASRLQAALPEAWHQYDLHCGGPSGSHPWKVLMTCLLSEAGVEASKVEEAVQWLWSEQPKRNLWRKPIAGMIELVRRIKAGGTQVAVISNSEGRLAQLAEELGWQDEFEVIADSGVLGFAKPGPQIFQWTSEAIGVPPENLIHIGDSWAADVEGILAVGGRGIWFAGATVPPRRPPEAKEGPRLRFTHNAAELEEALRSWEVSIA